MRRPLFSALVLAACVFPVKAGTLESAAHLRAQPMQFMRQQEGPVEACGANCRVFVFASGMITADTPRRFEAFAREHDLAGATMVFDSDGGSVRGALGLGRAIRKLGLDTTVGRKLDRSRRASRWRRQAASRCAPSSCSVVCTVRCRRSRACWCIKSGWAIDATTRWRRPTPPRISFWCSGTSAISCVTRPTWAAARN